MSGVVNILDSKLSPNSCQLSNISFSAPSHVSVLSTVSQCSQDTSLPSFCIRNDGKNEPEEPMLESNKLFPSQLTNSLPITHTSTSVHTVLAPVTTPKNFSPCFSLETQGFVSTTSANLFGNTSSSVSSLSFSQEFQRHSSDVKCSLPSSHEFRRQTSNSQSSGKIPLGVFP